MNQIDNFSLFIASGHAARTESIIKEHAITAVVNVAQDLNDPWYPNLLSIKIGLTDGAANLTSSYSLAMNTIIILLEQGHRVLLHCHEGRSRTAAIATLVVSKLNNLSKKEAFEFIGRFRPLCLKMEKSHWEHLNQIN